MEQITNQSLHKKYRRFKRIEGRYPLRHPLFLLHKPFLKLKAICIETEEEALLHASINWFFFQKKLELVKRNGKQYVFQLKVDIFTLDFVIQFYKENAFTGILDTPLGHLRFTGKKK